MELHSNSARLCTCVGYIIHFYVISDVLSFQNFFKTWLTDCGTDQEHIRIMLPSVFTPIGEGILRPVVLLLFANKRRT